MNAYLTTTGSRLRTGPGITSKSPEKRKNPSWLTTGERTVASHAGVAVYGRATASRRQQKAISRAFDDDVEFRERASEFVRYMVEVFSRHQIDIESEE